MRGQTGDSLSEHRLEIEVEGLLDNEDDLLPVALCCRVLVEVLVDVVSVAR